MEPHRISKCESQHTYKSSNYSEEQNFAYEHKLLVFTFVF